MPDRTMTLRFDRNEVSGAFGDLGTSLPLMVGMIAAAGLDATSVLVAFGALQVLTGLVYRLPMPVQPLKAVAAIVIAQKVSGGVVFGGGLAIGMLMLALTLTGALDWLARVVPRVVVRGMQCGLGLQLGRIAVAEYVPSAGVGGYALAAVAFAVVVLLMGNRRWPPAPLVLALGAVFALTMGGASPSVLGAVGLHLPVVHVPTSGEMWTGFVLLALPQIPLSLGNSVLATRQVAMDLFPEREPLSVRRIGITYSLMNVVSALVSGVPVCHGSGGMAGHYAFGGRTGGSVIIAGVTLATVGLLFGGSIGQIALFFPKPMLGVLLLFEGVAILSLLRDLGGDARELSLALFLGVVAAGLPYGYLVAMVLGTVLAKANVRLARA
ncbi:MAG: putative sulfate/molybdate transporter [bacterium]|jgi:Molybdate transporter of MFS superfamily